MSLNNYNSFSVESVEIYGDYGSWNPRTLQLTYNNNQIVDTQTTMGGVITLRPNLRGMLIDRDVFDVALNISGTIHIDRIVVNLRSLPTLLSEEVDIDQAVIIDTAIGAVDVDVFQITGIGKYHGYRVLSFGVESIASANSTLNTQLFVNTFNMGAIYVPNYSARQEFYLNPGNSVIGMGMDNMHLYMNGSGQLTRIHMKLVKY